MKTQKPKPGTLLWRGWCIIDKEKIIWHTGTEEQLYHYFNIRMYDKKLWKIVKAETRVVK